MCPIYFINRKERKRMRVYTTLGPTMGKEGQVKGQRKAIPRNVLMYTIHLMYYQLKEVYLRR